MAIQMILCVETKKSADTDSIYVFDTIKQCYKLDNKIKLSKINMGAKSKYNSKEIVRKIEKLRKAFVIGKTHVIYFVDTDGYEVNPEHLKELKEISSYCKNNGFEMVWFCHDIEEVYLGHKVHDSKKVDEACEFRKKKKIKHVKLSNLSSEDKYAGKSNILNIFDKYLERI